jgi:carbon-monoxide dehydrogenase large subunit
MFGQSIRRLEDRRFLTGHGRYVDDREAPPSTLRAIFLRSPHAHARLLSIDAGAARAAPGVHLVLTGADLTAAGIDGLPCQAVIASEEPLIIPPRPGLATDAVRYVGQPVACILAETPQQGQDAAELIEVQYEPLPAVVCPRAALEPDAPQLHGQAPSNLAFRWRKGDAEAVKAALSAAATVVRATIPNQRVTCAPIETRAVMAVVEDGLLTLHCNGQNMHSMRAQLSAAMGIAPETLRLTAPDVGGGFGMKNVAFPEHLPILHAARLLGRPVRWMAEMAEDFAAAAHGRGLHAEVALALDAEGRFLALEVDAVAEMGAYLSSGGAGCPTNAASTAMGGCYAIPAIHYAVRGVFSNTAPMEAYRGAGKPESNFIIETMIEKAAARTGIDAQALRAKNLIAALPHRTALGMEIRDGDFSARLAECARLADRAGFAARRAESAARGRRRGFGLTCFLETARGAPGEWSRLRVDAQGMVELAIGTQSNGQGHETSFPQYVAGLLDIPMDRKIGRAHV